jgi:hypothetical protein
MMTAVYMTIRVNIAPSSGTRRPPRHWRSLSVIAREITGGHWSGPRFFGLKEKQRASTDDEVAETVDA